MVHGAQTHWLVQQQFVKKNKGEGWGMTGLGTGRWEVVPKNWWEIGLKKR